MSDYIRGSEARAFLGGAENLGHSADRAANSLSRLTVTADGLTRSASKAATAQGATATELRRLIQNLDRMGAGAKVPAGARAAASAGGMQYVAGYWRQQRGTGLPPVPKNYFDPLAQSAKRAGAMAAVGLRPATAALDGVRRGATSAGLGLVKMSAGFYLAERGAKALG